MQSIRNTCAALLIATLLAPGVFLGIAPPKQANAQAAEIIGSIAGAGVSYALCEYGEEIREFFDDMLGGVLGSIFGDGDNPNSNQATYDAVPVKETNVQLKQNVGKIRTNYEMEVYKECILDPIAWVLKAILVNTVEQDILDWIDTGFEGGPVFLRDPVEYAKAISREMFERFLDESGVDAQLCTRNRDDFVSRVYDLTTQPTYGNQGSARCTVDDVFDTLAHNGSVEQYGITGAMALIEEGNNPYSSFFNLQAEAAQRSGEMVAREMTLADYNDGYHSMRCGYNLEEGVCTPGQLISRQVDDWLGGALGQLEGADEAAEVVSNLVANLVMTIFNNDERGLLGGHYLDDAAADGIANEPGYTNPIEICDEIDMSGPVQYLDPKYILEDMPITASVSFGFAGDGLVTYGLTYLEDPWPPYTASWNDHNYPVGTTGVGLGVCWNDLTQGGIVCDVWDWGLLDASGQLIGTKGMRMPAGQSYGIYMVKADSVGPDGVSRPERTNIQWVGPWPASHDDNNVNAGDLEQIECSGVGEDDLNPSNITEWREGRDVSNWPVTTDLTVRYSGTSIVFEFNQPSDWVEMDGVCADFYVVFENNGQWVAQNTDFIRCNLHTKYGMVTDINDQALYPIQSGDQVGFIVSNYGRTPYPSGAMERSNLYMTTWP